VYAEDPANNFLPDIGRLQTYRRPQGPGVRVDDGFREGMDIPIYYDPMIAKLVTYGKDREQAIERMLRAIDEYQITGISTTLSFCKFVLEHEAFVSGNFNTKFVELYFKPEVLENKPTNEELKVASSFVAQLANNSSSKKTQQKAIATSSSNGGWKKRARL